MPKSSQNASQRFLQVFHNLASSPCRRLPNYLKVLMRVPVVPFLKAIQKHPLELLGCVARNVSCNGYQKPSYLCKGCCSKIPMYYLDLLQLPTQERTEASFWTNLGFKV